MPKSAENGDARAEFRNTVVREARRHFARFGFRKTSVDEIARGLRMAKSSLYYYFRSKEEIFEAVLQHEAELFRSQIAAEVKAVQTAREKLEAYIITRMKVFRDLINFYQAFKDSYLENFPFVEKLRKDYDLEEVSYIAGILRQGVDRNEFNLREPETAAVVLATALKGLEFRWAASQDEAELRRNARDLLDVLFHGILRR